MFIYSLNSFVVIDTLSDIKEQEELGERTGSSLHPGEGRPAVNGTKGIKFASAALLKNDTHA